LVGQARKHAANRDWQLALDACRTALALFPDSVDAINLLAYIEERKNQEETLWQEALRPQHDNPIGRWLRRFLVFIVVVVAVVGTLYRFLLDFVV